MMFKAGFMLAHLAAFALWIFTWYKLTSFKEPDRDTKE